MTRWIDLHNHTDYSNIRLLDAISTYDSLAKRAKNIGLKGICFTEHECLSGSIKICELREKYPELKFGIGNEIYLVEERGNGQEYYHFLLIAKDAIGHKQLRRLSSLAWMQSYKDRGMERVPTLMSELEEEVKKNPGHLIATTACIGGFLGSTILKIEKASKVENLELVQTLYSKIKSFLTNMVSLFKDDFYIELAPGGSKDQIIANKALYSLANIYKIKLEISCDSHYATKEDRFIHKNFLTSKNGEREVDLFYEYSYLQDEEDILNNLRKSFGAMTEDIYNTCVENSKEIYDKITEYDLRHNQTIPSIDDVPYYPPTEDESLKQYPNLYNLKKSNNDIKRYWVNECLKSLKQKENEKKIDTNEESIYLAQLEKEADIKRTIGEKLDTNIFAYPIVLKHYIDLIWDCGSTIGGGRGSAGAGLNHWLLGITQYDPIKLNLPFERYMNWDTAGLPDIDIDICGSKRNLILQKVKIERGKRFNSDINTLSRKNLGCTLIATFGTASTKRAIQIACAGYRSEEYPDGIDVDESQYLSSLIPSERGFLWSIKDTYYGNSEKGRKPQNAFIQAVNSYPGLINIIFGIEGLIVSRSSHASGVILFDEDPYEFGCFMKTPKGEIITQYDLEDDENAGMTKYDWLITSVQDKITETIRLLQKYNKIDKTLSLREVYNTYLSPEVINFEDKEVWDRINQGNILDLFQFDSPVGKQGIKQVHPDNLNDLSNTNGVIRLMAEDGKEAPLKKYIRYKNNLDLWYDEMAAAGLTKENMKVFEKYMLKSFGVAISQECIMWSLMDKDICNFSLKDSNAARKVISKKKMDKLPALKEKIMSQAKSREVGQYEWDYVIMPSAGYGFSDIHSIFYSMIGYQTAYLVTKYPSIYWNTACLIVNSGSLEEQEEEEEIVSIYEPEDYEEYDYEDLPDRSGKKKIKKSTNYDKLAKSIGSVRANGINISLIDINKSDFSFEPDEEHNLIRFGLKGANKISDEVIKKIIEGRPYTGIVDFMKRCPLNKSQMISLIEAGAFDEVDNNWAKVLSKESRYAIMAYYISITSKPKKKLTLANLNGLIENGLFPEELAPQKRIYLFNKYLKQVNYSLSNPKALEIFNENWLSNNEIEYDNSGQPIVNQKLWEKKYQNEMSVAREWLKNNHDKILSDYNKILFMEEWNKYFNHKNNISAWEMDSVCFYYHQHELANINKYKYGISNFFNLPETPKIAFNITRGNAQIPIYELTKIIGTVISKDNVKSTVTILTPDGVVNVKFTKEYYAMFNRQISEIQSDGTKKVIEKSWFTRGSKILVTGFRRDDTFVAKKYAKTPTHQLYKITNDIGSTDMTMMHERAGAANDEN